MPFSPPSVTYRTTDMTRWGVGQGSDLSARQIDINFWDIYEAIVDLQDSSLGKQIAYVTTSTLSPNGEGLVVVYTDHSFDGPFPLPVLALDFRGVWQADTAYDVNDIFSNGTSLYICIYPTSGQSSFDPNANDGFGHNFYSLIFDVGAADQTPVQTQSADTWTPTLADANTYNRFTNAAGCSVILPDNATVQFPIGTIIELRSATSGPVMVMATSPAIINPQDSCEQELNGDGSTATVKKVDTDEWDLWGRLLPISGA